MNTMNSWDKATRLFTSSMQAMNTRNSWDNARHEHKVSYELHVSLELKELWERYSMRIHGKS
jgi:hypothetical protein